MSENGGSITDDGAERRGSTAIYHLAFSSGASPPPGSGASSSEGYRTIYDNEEDRPSDDGSDVSDDDYCARDTGTARESSTEGLRPTPLMKRVSTRYGARARKETTMKGFVQYFRGPVVGWGSRWFALTGSTLFYAKSATAKVHVEFNLSGAVVSEESTKNVENGLSIFLPAEGGRRIAIRLESRKIMEQWSEKIKSAAASTDSSIRSCWKGMHDWYLSANSGRQCNVCHAPCKTLMGKKTLTCSICSRRVHIRCVSEVQPECKWTTMASVPRIASSVGDGMPDLPHQWCRSAFPSGTKCAVCSKACGKKFEDTRCLWCRTVVHSVCKLYLPVKCDLGPLRLLQIPPTHVESYVSDSSARPGVTITDNLAFTPPPGCSPLIVFINPKSGSNDGVRLMRKLKGLLNPLQVFDLSQGGPKSGLLLASKLRTCRILGCGGDGTIGWILQEADKLGLKGFPVGVMPLGTGNDLSRVLGWSGAFSGDEADVVKFLGKVGSATPRNFDRWSVVQIDDNSRQHTPHHHAGSNDNGATLRAPAEKNSSPVIRSATPTSVQEDESSSNHGSSGATLLRFDSLREDSPLAGIAARLGDKSLTDPLSRTEIETFDGLAEPSSGTTENTRADVLEAAAVVKRLGRFLDLFFLNLNGVLSGQGGHVGDISAEDLTAMIEELSTALQTLCSRVTACPGIPKSGVAKLQEISDAIQEETLALLEVLHVTDTSDEDGLVALGLLQESVKEAVQSSKSIAVGAEVQMTSVMDRRKRASRRISTGLKGNGEKFNIPAVNKTRLLAGWMSSATLQPTDASSQSSVPAPTQMSSISEGKEISVMNNYFGIGLDAKIAMDFGTFRDNNPEKCRNRIKNQLWYGFLGTKEMLAQTCKNLHERLTLVCDGTVVPLSRLQGIVILNIGSYMGGTNFWGNKVQRRFRPPAYDDGLLEVVAVKGTMQMAAIKSIPGIQPTRLAQARMIEIIIGPGDDIPVQVDGEAQMVSSCTLRIAHKGRVQLLCRDKALQRLIGAWDFDTDQKSESHSADLPVKPLEKSATLLSIAARAACIAPSGAYAVANHILPACQSYDAALKKVSGSQIRRAADITSYLKSINNMMETILAYIGIPDFPQPPNAGSNRILFESLGSEVGPQLKSAMDSCTSAMKLAKNIIEGKEHQEHFLLEDYDRDASQFTAEDSFTDDTSHRTSVIRTERRQSTISIDL